MKRIFIPALTVMMLPLAAYGSCVSPAGKEGQLIYNADYHIPQYCNGTQWMPFSAIDPAARRGRTMRA